MEYVVKEELVESAEVRAQMRENEMYIKQEVEPDTPADVGVRINSKYQQLDENYNQCGDVKLEPEKEDSETVIDLVDILCPPAKAPVNTKYEKLPVFYGSRSADFATDALLPTDVETVDQWLADADATGATDVQSPDVISLEARSIEDIMREDDYVVHLYTLILPYLYEDDIYSGRICTHKEPGNTSFKSRRSARLVAQKPRRKSEKTRRKSHTTSRKSQKTIRKSQKESRKSQTTRKSQKTSRESQLNVKNKCRQCEKFYAQKSSLYEHVRNVHQGIKRPRNAKCDVCRKMFCDKTALAIHASVHTGERPFACSDCNKTYKRKQHLKEHIKFIHTGLSGLKPHQCNVCSAKFGRKCAMNLHMKRFH